MASDLRSYETDVIVEDFIFEHEWVNEEKLSAESHFSVVNEGE